MGISEKFTLKDKVALVTGASYGIGYAIASGFADMGAKIVFCDIKQEFVDMVSLHIVLTGLTLRVTFAT